MRKLLRTAAVAAALFWTAAPAHAAWNDFANWSFCSNTSFSVCMKFNLVRDGSTNNYRLRIDYASTTANPGEEGAMTSAGLYRDKGKSAVDLNVSKMSIYQISPSGASWAIGSNQLGGDGPIVIEVAGNSNNGINNGLPVGGYVIISFTSNNLANYDLNALYARSQIQSFGPNDCSLKPDSRNADNVVGGRDLVDADCGGATVTPEPLSIVLLGSGLAGVASVARRRRDKGDAADV